MRANRGALAAITAHAPDSGGELDACADVRTEARDMQWRGELAEAKREEDFRVASNRVRHCGKHSAVRSDGNFRTSP